MRPWLALLPASLLLAARAAGAAPAPPDHSAFDSLLAAHVRSGLVDYEAFARSDAFRGYLGRLAGADLAGLAAAERLAFWINVYNAWTIELVNRHGRPASIRDVKSALVGTPVKDAWSERLVEAAGRSLTLDELEHQVIRREFREPRVHFALVCAALGCPPLRGEAYTGAALERQLDEQARLFLAATPAKNRVDVAAGTLFVSPILSWYREDFGGDDAAIGRFVARYLSEGREKALLQSGRFQLRETPYDWSLNAAATRRR